MYYGLDFALRLVWQSAPGWTIASLAILVVQGVLPLLSLYLMKLIVEDGRIIENGTHNELVHRGGMYARLFETQAQYYR